MSLLASSTTRILFAALLLVTLSACENPLTDDDDHDDDHAEVEALGLFMGGVEVVAVAEAAVSGKIVVAAGEKSGLISVEFRDHDGDEIHDEDLDEEFSLGLIIGDETVATLEQEGRWGFRINGLKADTTQLTVQLLHAGHPDFTTPAIPVEVTQ